ncbi:hypothetical protein HanIR_Chr16g0821291 [Helianthus annuus]|nr:hypothetical protein HanIR_Chr16g0821291 [Helianthus annuus]
MVFLKFNIATVLSPQKSHISWHFVISLLKILKTQQMLALSIINVTFFLSKEINAG